MKIRLILLIWLVLGSTAHAQWPQWLGKEIRTAHQTDWEIDIGPKEVRFVPRGEHPVVWVLLSKKAKSYDTALSTILKVFRRNLSGTAFHIFLMPKESKGLKELVVAAEKQANLIYTVGSKATVAMHKAYAGGRLPVVSVNAKDPVMLGLTDNYQTSKNNFAFTSLNLPPKITLSFLRQFKPDLKQIGVLYAKNNTSAFLTQYLPLKKEAEKTGIRIYPFEVDEANPDQTLDRTMDQKLAEMKENDPDFNLSLLWLTGSSSLLERISTIGTHSQGLPLLTVVPDAVNGSESSALMSVGVGFENNAHQAALYGIQIIKDGIDPAALPVGILSPPDISISFRQAQRINAQIPFVLIEMASDLYAQDGRMIRSAGMSLEE